VFNQANANQTPAAAVRTYIVGSSIAVPAAGLIVGTSFRWVITITKTAAGLAASTFDIAVGTTGSVSDAAVLSFTKPAGTAVADEGVFRFYMTIRSVGASGTAIGEFEMVHNLSATGHATIPTVAVSTLSGSFVTTTANLIVGVCVTSGASDAITIKLVQAEGYNF
jgi:hypothetical protein